jgi:hypothetical protein
MYIYTYKYLYNNIEVLLMAKKIIFTQKQLDEIIMNIDEDDNSFEYLDDTDPTVSVPGSEVSAVGIVGDSNVGQKNPTTDQQSNFVARQNYWWSRSMGAKPINYSMTKEEFEREYFVDFLNEWSGRKKYYGGNSGYQGYSMSNRAVSAKEEGRYPKGEFRRNYNITDKSMILLIDAGIINDKEWHHTSKYGNKTIFFSWYDDSYYDIYKENKIKIDKLALQYEKNIDKDAIIDKIKEVFDNNYSDYSEVEMDKGESVMEYNGFSVGDKVINRYDNGDYGEIVYILVYKKREPTFGVENLKYRNTTEVRIDSLIPLKTKNNNIVGNDNDFILDNTSIKPGDTIEHPRFGRGKVMNGDEKILLVNFDNEGEKQLVKKFTKLKKINEISAKTALSTRDKQIGVKNDDDLWQYWSKHKFESNTQKKNSILEFENNNQELDINDFLDPTSEQKIQIAIQIINQKLRQPQARHQAIKYFLNNINKSNLTADMKINLRNIVNSNY